MKVFFSLILALKPGRPTELIKDSFSANESPIYEEFKDERVERKSSHTRFLGDNEAESSSSSNEPETSGGYISVGSGNESAP